MSLRRLSPTANLLRTSRLFSLPPPLPRPSPDLSAISNFDSDTATTPYPTHAAIETTQSSLARGDWGLKRNLPLKSTTKTSTPVIYIDNVDSIDHITDFGSAADHALTLRKWQELDMPLSIPEKRKTVTAGLPAPRSVFDSDYDNTVVSQTKSSKGSSNRRWKYKGPWLAGKTEGEFNDYVEKKVKKRKLDFRQYLGQCLARNITANRRREAMENGEEIGDLSLHDAEITEQDVETYIRHLRNNERELYKHVEEYLDLPREEGQSSVEYDLKGPPTTHPSAGLSYLRTDSHIYNHPELGPQEHKAPVKGRIIVPQKVGDRMNTQALIGVAGVVGKDHKIPFFKNPKPTPPGLGQYDPDIPGGGKLWAHPKRANIDSHGRIELTVNKANENALNVALGVHSDGPELPAAAIAGAQDRDVPDLAPPRPKASGNRLGYGLEDFDGKKDSGRATPFLGPDDPNPTGALHDLIMNGSPNTKT